MLISTAKYTYATSISFLTTELAYSLSMKCDQCYRRVVAPWCCGGKFSICATQNMILESYAKIDSNSFKTRNTHSNDVVRCNTMPNNCKYVHAYQDIIPFKNSQKLITCKLQSRVAHTPMIAAHYNLSAQTFFHVKLRHFE